MTNQPDKPTPPRKPPYDFGPNSRDVTAERAGTVFGIIGATHLRPRPPQPTDSAPSPAPSPAPPERK